MTLTPKRQTLLGSNGKIIRHDGKTYRIIAQKVGQMVLVDAEQIAPRPSQLTLVNLLGKNKLNQTLWNLVEQGLIG